MNFLTVVARQTNLASAVYKKINTALPILTEIVKDIVEVSDTSKSSCKHACSKFVWSENHCSKCAIFLPSVQCGNSPYRPYSRPQRTSI